MAVACWACLVMAVCMSLLCVPVCGLAICMGQVLMNMIAKNLIAQHYNEGQHHLMMLEMMDHEMRPTVLQLCASKSKRTNSHAVHCQSTKRFRFEWKDSSANEMSLKRQDLQYANPIDLAYYTVINNLPGYPSFLVVDTTCH